MRLPLAALAMLLTACGSTATAPTPTAQVVATGQFDGKSGEQVSGGYRIERSGGHLTLVLGADFQSSAGPDLHVVLSPMLPAAVQNATALADGAAMVVAPLRAQQGEQRYALPDTTTLARHRSVLVYCVRYTHLYGAAPM